MVECWRGPARQANAGTMSIPTDTGPCIPPSLGIIKPFEPELKIKFVCVCVRERERERERERKCKVWGYRETLHLSLLGEGLKICPTYKFSRQYMLILLKTVKLQELKFPRRTEV
jgi:hypothetical protein